MSSGEFHLNYSRDEDRVYVFVRDGEGVEHAFALTRHLFKKLWPALGKTVQEMSEAVTKTTPEMKNDVLQFEQQGAVSEAIQSGTLSNKPLPEVENRITYLVKTIRIGNTAEGAKTLTLSDGDRSMNIPINHDQLIVLCDALKALAMKSDWDLNPRYPWEEDAARETEEAADVTLSAGAAPTRH